MATMIRRVVLSALLLLAAVPAWSQDKVYVVPEQDGKAQEVLSEGVRLMQSQRAAEALAVFTRVAADFEARYKDPSVTYYSKGYSALETLAYVAQGATTGNGRTQVVSGNWSYAYYLKGYVLLELKRIGEAKTALQRAVVLWPQNAQYLSELAHAVGAEKDWIQSLELYQRAEAAAKEFSPANRKNNDIGRAWRGQGYVLVELKRWDEAELRYLQCLGLNEDDKLARRELLYIQRQKAALPR